ncbi:MAG: serine hydrolase [Anaerolineae bacterium]|nr:serine hydrolase [Anaerolineae bacterium]
MSTTVTTLSSRRKPRRLPIIPLLSALMLLTAIGWFIVELVRFSQQSDRLPLNVSVAGVDVGGMSPSDAMRAWESVYNAPVTLWYADSPIQLDPAAVGFRTSRDTMLAAARRAGGGEGQYWLDFFNYLTGRRTQAQAGDVPLVAEYQPQLLEQWLRTEIVPRYDRAPGGASFDLQTLTLRPGASGYRLDVEAAMPLIDAALRRPDNRVVTLPVEGADGRGIGLEVLRSMIIDYLDAQGFIFDGQSTVASVFVMDLETGEEMNINGDVAFSAASTAKVAILIDYYRSLLTNPSQDEAYLMSQSLLCSNNSSSNLIMQIIGNNDLFAGLADIVNTTQYIGARNTFITAPFDLGIAGQQLGSIPVPITEPNPNFNTAPDPVNQTTTEDLGTMFEMIYDCAYSGSGLMTAYPDGEFNQTECRQMLNLMSANNLERLLQAGIPAGVTIAHKNGWLDNVHGDAGIVFPPNGRNYIIAVFVWENTDFFSFDRAWPLIEEISRATWNYFNPSDPLLQRRTDIPPTAQECVDFAPPYGQVNLDDINAWRTGGNADAAAPAEGTGDGG